MSDTPIRDRPPISADDALPVLREAPMEVLGRMPWSSNATFLVDLDDADHDLQAVYKPVQGERPLWDFPTGLARREVAAFELSHHLGWDLVPPTVLRTEGPLGVGSLQLFVPADFEQHYFTIRDDPAHEPTLQRLCAFDIIANSTDRKGGHCLFDSNGEIWAIDNGLSFHTDFKLRTVIWDYAGETIPADIVAEVASFIEGGPPESFADLLDDDEVDAAMRRASALITDGCFPVDHTGRRWPWPMV
ncbi:MAG: SCO1664 family protein [Acidimicrobiales bacterium]